MKCILKACLSVCVILVVLTVCAFAEPEHGALIRDELQSPEHGALIRTQTPELGDSSIATVALVGLAGLTLTGAVVAHKKARSNAQ